MTTHLIGEPAISIAALLRASDLPTRWRGRPAFAMLAVGAAGLELLEAIELAWHADPTRCERLDAIAIDAAWPARRPEADWPPATPGFHRIERAGGRIQWLFAHGDGEHALRELVANVDAFILVDGRGAAHRPSLFARRPGAIKGLARLAAPDASLVSEADDAVRAAGLRAAGFVIRSSSERGHDCERGAGPDPVSMLSAAAPLRADFKPARLVRRPAGRPPRGDPGERRAVIIGAGLAGCATAWALAQHGWTSTLLERRSRVAAEASGNPAGLFHGIVNGVDGPHARFNRAAALEARAAVAVAMRDHGVRGAHDGLIQLVDPGAEPDSMRALLARLKLPADFVAALDAREASAAAGIPLTRPAWLHAQGGWVDPAGLCRSYLERAGAAVRVRFDQPVASLRRDADGWTLLDRDGRRLESTAVVVLANAGAAFEWIGAAAWPVESVRGQLSVWRPPHADGLCVPLRPIAGAGYVVPARDAGVIFGATAFANDDDASVRDSDHRLNLAQLESLSVVYAGVGAAGTELLEGRTAWRCVARDRLPVIGAVPASPPSDTGDRRSGAREDQPRRVAREPGLFVLSGLGSRGISWSALGAQVLAALITGAPSPIEASLLDAVDPARFQVRDERRRTATKSQPARRAASKPKAGTAA